MLETMLLDVLDLRTGRVVLLEVPEQAGAHWLGWGPAPRVAVEAEHGDGAPHFGVLVKMAPGGVVYLDELGEEHEAPHGRAQVFLPSAAPAQDPEEAELAKAAPKAGQRWITVHPNGHDSTGVPVLIQEHPDGTARIIGGAGGKLTHLILHGVGSKEEHDARAKAKARERAQADKARKDAQTPDERAAEHANAASVRELRRQEERGFVERTRRTLGGVREDLTDTDHTRLVAEGLSDAQIKAVETAHHRAQYKEAVQRAREVLSGLAGRTEGQAHQRAALEATEEDPALHEARGLAMAALDAEQETRTAAQGLRQANRERVTGGDPELGRRAAEAIGAAITDAEDPTKGLARLDEIPPEERKASDEVARRALVAQERAKALLAGAEGHVDGGEHEPVVAQILQAAGVQAGAPEAAEVLRQAAAQAWRQSEILGAQRDKLAGQEAEGDDGAARARRTLNYADQIRQMARDRGEAVRMGLTDTVQAGLKEVDLAEARALAEDFARHQHARRELRDLAAAVEGPDFDCARRAFDLHVSDPPPDVQASIEDDVRRSLTEQLLGVANARSADYQTAVAAGHHDGLADVSLGLAGQRYVDRLAMDALGPRHAALLIRHALEQDGHDPDAVLEALERHHVQQVTEATTRALRRAEKVAPGLQQQLAEVGDFERAAAALKLHEADIAEAQRTVGTTLGRLEATAALAQTLRQPLPEALTLDTRRAGVDRTLAWLHAAGLRPEHYQIDAESKTITIPRSSWDALITRTDPGETKLREQVQAIKRGDHDEAGWLPPGIVRREASTFTAPVGVPAPLAEPLDLGAADIHAAVERHAGGRLAEGQHPVDVMQDMLSAEKVRAAADPQAYVAAVKDVFPILNEQGERIKLEDQQGHFQKVAERFMRAKYGSTTGAFHAQDIGVDDPQTHEALFRTLAQHPEAPVAFKPTGELTHQDQRTLRDTFYALKGIDPKRGEDDARFTEAMAALGPEPDPNKGTLSMFGPRTGPSPEWRDWKRRQAEVFAQHPRASLTTAIQALGPRPTDAEGGAAHDAKVAALQEAARKAPTAWSRFVGTHGSLQLAQQAIQDEIKGRFLSSYLEHHAKVTGRPLRSGVVEITNAERHVPAMASPEQAEALRAEAQAMQAQLRERVGGRFAAEGEGAVREKYTRHLEQETIDRQNQGALFGARPAPTAAFAAAAPAPPRPPKLGERVTVGERAENQIASLMPHLGAQFQPGRPVGLFSGLNMDGARVPQQRVLKHLDAIKRVIGALGTGSGKSLISIGGFTQAHDKGETQHGLYLVPSAVADQFGGEMLRYTEPGRYRWKVSTGLDHEARVAMLKDPSLHMRVFTHQAFRDTALRVMADHHGVSVEDMKQRLAATNPRGRARLMREAFDAAGIPRHYTYYDEAHTAEKREDTDPSSTNLVRSAVTHPVNATHYLHGTATPVKNDAAELFSVAETIDPDRYHDRGKFLQDFGQATAHNPSAIRRELAPHLFTARIDPDVTRQDIDNPTIQGGGMFGTARKVAGGPLPLHPEHQKLVDRVDELYQRARGERRQGRADIEALRELSPGAFRGHPETAHAAIADRLNGSLGIVKEAALRRAVNAAPAPINTKLQAMTAVIKHDLGQTWTDRQGKRRQGRRPVIFTDKASEARLIHEHLNQQGVRAALYHGGLTPAEREQIRLGFQPEDGSAPKYDAVVATASAEAGVNMQSASVIHHYDVPLTWKSHAQRSGRAYRQGQQGDVDVHNWHTATDYEQRARRRLATKRELASVLEDPTAHLDEHGITGHYRAVLNDRHQADLLEAA